MNESAELNKSLKDSFNLLSGQRDVRPLQNTRRPSVGGTGDDNDEEESEREEVVILHESMCRYVNNTLLSREKVNVKKVWAPDINKMEEALDDVSSNVVVLEAWTRDLVRMDVNDMNQRIDDLVSKALTKAEKVVVSTIINRDDVEDIDLKLDSVNAFMKLKYKRNDSVIVCDNYKLRNSKFRNRDKIHLNDDGVKVFASNLKYAIADAADVRVIKKQYGNYDEQGFGYDEHRPRRNDYRR